MTVDSITDNQVDCFWTGADGQPNAESFSRRCTSEILIGYQLNSRSTDANGIDIVEDRDGFNYCCRRDESGVNANLTT
jgi:hypothetical protein